MALLGALLPGFGMRASHLIGTRGCGCTRVSGLARGGVHEVTLAPFAISRCLVTAALYQGVGEDPAREGEGAPVDEGLPVNEGLPANEVSWYDAVAFCNRLSLRARRTPCYQIVPAPDGGAPQVTWDRSADGYRLPTEAEWEYAARGGTTSRFFCGDDETALGRYAWFDGNSKGRPHPVGEKEPNPFGLYDMAGNLWEWCWDVYGPYRAGPQADPALQEEAAPSAGGERAREDGAEGEAGEGVDKGGDSPPRRVALRVLRGGSFDYGPGGLRSASRNWLEPGLRDWGFGFRCVRGSRRQD